MTWLVNPIDWVDIGALFCSPICWCTSDSWDILCTCFMGWCDVKYNASEVFPDRKNDF